MDIKDPISVHILLAEDDPDDREFFAEAINELGQPASFSYARNGIEVMSFLGSGLLPDMIFLDLNMPLQDGLSCLKEIRKAKNLREVFVIVYSTSADQGHIDATFEAGANFYVQKPSSFNKLKNVISEVFRHYISENERQRGREKFFLDY